MQVEWDSKRCTHAGVCVGSLPLVFTARNGALAIDPTKAEPDAVRDVVARCPSGALTIVEPN